MPIAPGKTEWVQGGWAPGLGNAGTGLCCSWAPTSSVFFPRSLAFLHTACPLGQTLVHAEDKRMEHQPLRGVSDPPSMVSPRAAAVLALMGLACVCGAVYGNPPSSSTHLWVASVPGSVKPTPTLARGMGTPIHRPPHPGIPRQAAGAPWAMQAPTSARDTPPPNAPGFLAGFAGARGRTGTVPWVVLATASLYALAHAVWCWKLLPLLESSCRRTLGAVGGRQTKRNPLRPGWDARSHFAMGAVTAQEEAPTSSTQTEDWGRLSGYDWARQWYPVGWCNDLAVGELHKVTLFDTDYVVVRSASGEGPTALLDRCPHRLAALSEGRVTAQGKVQCAYHGWSFDAQGQAQVP